MSASYRITRLPHSPAFRELSISIRGLSPISGYEDKFGCETYLHPCSTAGNFLVHIAHQASYCRHLFRYRPTLGVSPTHPRALAHAIASIFPSTCGLIFDGQRSENWLCQNSTRVDLHSVSLSLPNLRHLRLSCYFVISYILLKEITAENCYGNGVCKPGAHVTRKLYSYSCVM